MGGSGGGSWTPSVPSSPCSRLAFIAVINSPQQAVVSTLSVGDVLQVSLLTNPVITVVVTKNGAVAGSITCAQLSQLISCLQNGYDFEATVDNISGAHCKVRVNAI